MNASRLSRRDWLTSSAVLAFSSASSGLFSVHGRADEQGPSAMRHDRRRQLFFDDSLIESRQGIVKRVHPAKKEVVPVLSANKPWEGTIVCQPVIQYSTERRRFQMWYYAFPGGPFGQGYTCYAESADGVQWEKPNLGIFAYRGSSDNNILSLRNGQGWIVLDPADPVPARRYKGFIEEKNRFRATYSPDGIRWAPGELAQGIEVHDDSPGLFHDPARRRFVFVKRKLDRSQHRRMIETAVSRDFIHWKLDEHVLQSTEHDSVRAAARGAQRLDFYGLSATPYEGIYLGLLDCFYLWRLPGNRLLHDGPIEVELAWSRDGVQWIRAAPGQAVLSIGGAGMFDDGMVLAAPSPIVHRGEIHCYYTGADSTHGADLRGLQEQEGPAAAEATVRSNSIGLARWRLDRFVSLDADDEVRNVITKPLEFPWNSLVINADASHGSIRVEVQDSRGKAVVGYEAAHCEPLVTDELAHKVRWLGRTELPMQRPLTLRFVMKNASLFAMSSDGSS